MTASVANVAPAAAVPVAAAAPRAASAGFYMPSLDGLRAISFLVVFVAHAGLHDVVPGGFGVTVFFFLSGYLITTLMRMEHARSGTVSLRHFYLRRVLRILPPFYLVLGVSSVLVALGLLGGTLEPWPLLAQALHFGNYWMLSEGYAGAAPGTGVLWSLAVEEHFYFVFPMVYLLLQRLGLGARSQALTLWGLCAAVLAWRCVLVLGLGVATDRTYMASDTRVDSILFGCALAVWHNPVLDAGGRPLHAVWRRVLLPLGLATLLATFLVRGEAFRETVRYSLQGLALVPVFVVALREPGWGVMRLLNLRGLAFVGTLSYSLYLVHHIVIYALEHHLPALHGLARGVLALGVSMALAYAIYVWVEQPCARLRRRLSH